MSQTLETRSSAPGSDRLTAGGAARLSRYLQVLTQAKKMGKERISSQEIADYTNINATQIRRDLSNFGKFGKRGVGYSIDSLLAEVRKILRTQGQHNIALVGAGRLGQAIASSSIFAEHGINIAAVFDSDDARIGHEIGGATIEDERERLHPCGRTGVDARRARGRRRLPGARAGALRPRRRAGGGPRPAGRVAAGVRARPLHGPPAEAPPGLHRPRAGGVRRRECG